MPSLIACCGRCRPSTPDFPPKKYAVKAYAYASNAADPRVTTVSGAGALLADPHFVQSSVVVYEFGIYYGLFNSLLPLPDRVRKIVQYHNITPEHLVAAGRA